MKNNNRYLEFFGVASVVASLIFVGIQIKQTNDATRSATVLQIKDSWVQLNLAYATSPELVAAEHEVLTNGWDDASIQSQMLFAGTLRTLFHIWSNAYFQYQNGTLGEDQWAPIKREIIASMEHEAIKRVWTDVGYLYDDDFRTIVDQEIRKGP